MKRLALFAAPLLFLAATGVVIHWRRGSRRDAPPPYVEVSLSAARRPASSAAGAAAGVEVLVGYDEQHEAEEEVRHGALLHIDVPRLSVGQI